MHNAPSVEGAGTTQNTVNLREKETEEETEEDTGELLRKTLKMYKIKYMWGIYKYFYN